MARLWAEACSARRPVLARHWVPVWRLARPAALLKVARHALTAVAAYPEERVAEREAVAPLRAERPEATVSLQQVAVFLQVAEAEARSLARSGVEFGREARRWEAARTSVVEAAAVPTEELDAVAAEVRPQVVAHAAGPRPAAQCAPVAREAAGVLADAAVPPPEAGAELDEAVPLLAAAQIEAGEEEAARRRAALGEVAARRGAVAWVFHPDRLLLWPGP